VPDMMRTYVGHVARVLEASAGAAG
jgi:hypothetical protein